MSVQKCTGHVCRPLAESKKQQLIEEDIDCADIQEAKKVEVQFYALPDKIKNEWLLNRNIRLPMVSVIFGAPDSTLFLEYDLHHNNKTRPHNSCKNVESWLRETPSIRFVFAFV
ncbi:hypothetical protein RF11_01116 [Thelohanellus kitauei]|uniref:Uncharacterized protein n=1 Tax=Thelohanellus kitauei TaxID=669202 RepID=A0A0C2JS75_THEKT|nr:hypothetical protein RF11_01116 [Thelohanellus kitauei]